MVRKEGVNLDPLFHDYSGNVPGASVIVIRDGKVVVRNAFGMANLEEHIEATPETHDRLASVTKQFTAAAILTLAGDKKLSLDDPIRRWLPSLPGYADAITIRHLLTHTSGLIDYEDVIPSATTKPLTDADVLRLLETQTATYFPPGSSYRYSNSGYVLLALIVEKGSGQRFAAFLHDRIFEPLGMKTTVAHEEGISTVAHRAYGYSREGGGWRRTDQSVTSATLGDGGIYTSVDDLVPWITALEKGRFAEASVPRVETDEKGVRYGFGWKIGEHDGQRIVFHTGESIGFRNAVVRFPDEHLAIIVLTNRNEGHPKDLAISVRESLRSARR
ncbi:MAG TPA: serine hydrolase domain-containing protein [Thermoanaerobaculia bacterium]|nr:serine hydrolase domain-containing protein [Thermoanaerobaculia bacterium]